MNEAFDIGLLGTVCKKELASVMGYPCVMLFRVGNSFYGTEGGKKRTFGSGSEVTTTRRRT